MARPPGAVVPGTVVGRARGVEACSSTLKALAIDALGFLLAKARFVFHSSVKEKITN